MVFTEAKEETVPITASAEEKGIPTKGIIGVTVEEDAPVKAQNLPPSISPHPLVNFAEVPAICGEQSNHAVAVQKFDSKRPLSMGETVPSSLGSSGAGAGSSLSEESFTTPARAALNPQCFSETHTHDVASLMSTSKFRISERTVPNAQANASSTFATTDAQAVPGSPHTFDARRRREAATAGKDTLKPLILGLGFKDCTLTSTNKPVAEGSSFPEVSNSTVFFPRLPENPGKTWESLFTSGANFIDQVTPTQTDGTYGMVRNQWKFAGGHLPDFTEICRGLRTQPINMASPGAGMKGTEDVGSQLEEESPPQGPEGALLSTDSIRMYKKTMLEDSDVGGDLDNGEDRAVLEDDNRETGESEDEGKTEHGDNDICTTTLDQSTVPEGHEGGFDGETKIDSQVISSTSTSADIMSRNFCRETSFRTGEHKQTVSALRFSVATSPTAALQLDASAAVSKSPFGEDSTMFHDLGKSPEVTNEETNQTPNLPQQIFRPPRLQDFEFGGTSGGVPVFGRETKSLIMPEQIPEPVSTGIFNFSRTFFAQAPQHTHDTPRYGQDFDFSGTNGAVSLTANQRTPSCSLAPVPEHQSFNASSVSPIFLVEETSSVIGQAEEEISTQNTTEKERTEENTPLHTPSEQKPKGKKARKSAQKKEKPQQQQQQQQQQHPNLNGPNRAQRRAASRERKAAEKKAQIEAKAAKDRGRREVAVALMRV